MEVTELFRFAVEASKEGVLNFGDCSNISWSFALLRLGTVVEAFVGPPLALEESMFLPERLDQPLLDFQRLEVNLGCLDLDRLALFPQAAVPAV